MNTLESHPKHRPPHLSHSRINRYLTCPEQYRLYYVVGLRLRIDSANLIFGKAIHRGLEQLFSDGRDAVEGFEEAWEESRETDIAYSHRSTWESLLATGRELLEGFATTHLERITRVRAVERRFEVQVTGFDLPLVGFIDLVADLDGRPTLIDFKTAGATYPGHEADLSDQLTTYQLVEPDAEQSAFCVLVKTKKPKIIWQITRRNGSDLDNYVRKAKLVEEGILKGEFYRRSGFWCRWCDYLPVCVADSAKVEATLIQIGDQA